MKTGFNQLRKRLRARWHLHQARTVIARCDRAVARRKRVPDLRKAARAPFFFAPGVIDAQPARRRGMRPYLVTVAVAIAAGLVYVMTGGLPS